MLTKPTTMSLTLSAAMALCAVSALSLEARAERPFSVAYSDVIPGNLARTGNTIVTCDRRSNRTSATVCNRIEATTGTIQDNNNSVYTRHIDIDNDASTFASSAGTLTVPPSSQIEWAGLYWNGTDKGGASCGTANNDCTLQAPGNNNQIKLRAPNAPGYVTITADWCDSIGVFFQCFALVTPRVIAARSGEYIVADISTNTGRDDFIGGWELVTAYREDSESLRSLSVQHGHARYNNTTPQEFTFGDFLAPLSGPISGFVSISTTEGDAGEADRARFNYNAMSPPFPASKVNVELGNPLSPPQDLGNGSIATAAGNVLSRRPAHINTLGHDIDEFSVDSFLINGQTSTTVRLDDVGANGESNSFYKIAFSVEIYSPRITNRKSVVDLNGGDAVSGDTLAYTIVVANDPMAFDSAVNLRLADALPAGLTYVPGSMNLIAGIGSPAALTDSDTDPDAGQYDAVARTLRVNLGAGANSLMGGTLAPGESVTLTFQATVDPVASNRDLSNTAVVTYEGASLVAGAITRPVNAPSNDPNQPIFGPTVITVSPDPDGDGLGQSDLDEDDDGVLDQDEYRGGLDPELDTDNDGLRDWEDNDAPGFVDTNMDGIDDRFDADLDGLPNHLDLDTDGDGVFDLIEAEGASLDANNDGRVDGPDSDNDGLRDAVDADLGNASLTSLVSDNDGVDDLFDTDDDGDGVLTMFEDVNNDGDFLNDNTDGDMLPNYRDSDDDGDGVLTTFEASDPDMDGDPLDALDFDLDGAPDYLDADDDNDGLLTSLEGADANMDGDPSDALNTDLDGAPDYLDADDDNDGKPTLSEDVNANGIYTDDDTDGDLLPNYLDANDDDGPTGDPDGDGLTTAQETALGTDPNSADSDADGLCDGIVAVATICTAGEDAAGGRDSDSDGTIDALDADDDNDGVLTIDEDLDNDGDYDEHDANMDGVPAYLDGCEPDATSPACLDPDADPDMDNLTNAQEILLGTDPNNADSDGDGLRDDIEVANLNNPADTDNDGVINANDPDDDGDSILTIDEDLDQDGDPRNDNSDGDALPNYLDADDDNDGLLTRLEDVDQDGDPRNDDTDGDALPNYLDADDDDDGKPTLSEDLNANGVYTDDDSDGDLIPNYLDADDADGPTGDTDGDGLTNTEEAALGTDPNTADSDSDGLCDGLIAVATVCVAGEDAAGGRDSDNDGVIDALDADDDDDGVLTIDEDLDNDGDPTNDDSNADNIPDYLDVDDDGDGVLTVVEDVDDDGDPRNDDNDGDGLPNYLDVDDDGDTILTRDEDIDGDGDPGNDDSDSDGLFDYLDPDDDNDTILTRDEDLDGDGDPRTDNSDASLGDTLPNYLDSDDDGDNVSTTDEDLDLDGDPRNDDTNMNGIPDYLDPCDPDPAAQACVSGDTDGDGTPNDMEPDDAAILDPCRPNPDALACSTGDTDGDGIPNAEERMLKTDPSDADSDADGVCDGTVTVATVCVGGEDAANNQDTDNDGTIDALDPDDDGDSIPTIEEDLDQDGDPTNDDTDGDNTPNYLDPDDDGDGLPTLEEDLDQDGDLTNDDTDGDNTPNYLDPDDDGDAIPTLEEDLDNDGDYDEHDTDGDGIPNYLDPDDQDGPDGDADGDTISNRDEDLDRDGNPDNDDTDGDGIPNYLDPDDDNDTILTRDEDLDGDGDPRTDNSDALLGDTLPNYLDPDDDGDGVLTRDEDVDMDGDPTNDDTNMDGVPDYLDPCDPNPNELACQFGDTDGDGTPNDKEPDDAAILDPCRPNPNALACPTGDTDMDGLTNAEERQVGTNPLDADSDMDGVSDGVEVDDASNPRDSDMDGAIDALDPDDDNDGVLTRFELGPDAPTTLQDTDNDTVPDYLDPDDDGDGVPTRREGADPNRDGDPQDALDVNKNGVPDYLDATYPQTPDDLTITSPTDGATVGQDFTVSGSGPAGEVVEIFVDGTKVGEATVGPDGMWSFELEDQAEGERVVSASSGELKDSVTVTVDLAAGPEVEITSPTDGATVASDFTVSGTTSQPNTSVDVFVDGVLVTTVMSDDQGNWSAELTDQADGERQIEAIIIGDSDSITVTVDAAMAPADVEITSPTDGATVASTFTVTGTTNSANQTVEVFIDGEKVGEVISDAQGNWTLALDGVEAGERQIEARIEGDTDSITVTVDETVTPLAVSITSPSEGDQVGPDFTVSGTASADAEVEVFVDGVSAGTVTADGDGAWTLDLDGVEAGEREITARATKDGLVADATPVSVTVLAEDDPFAGYVLSGGCSQSPTPSSPLGVLWALGAMCGAALWRRRRRQALPAAQPASRRI